MGVVGRGKDGPMGPSYDGAEPGDGHLQGVTAFLAGQIVRTFQSGIERRIEPTGDEPLGQHSGDGGIDGGDFGLVMREVFARDLVKDIRAEVALVEPTRIRRCGRRSFDPAVRRLGPGQCGANRRSVISMCDPVGHPCGDFGQEPPPLQAAPAECLAHLTREGLEPLFDDVMQVVNLVPDHDHGPRSKGRRRVATLEAIGGIIEQPLHQMFEYARAAPFGSLDPEGRRLVQQECLLVLGQARQRPLNPFPERRDRHPADSQHSQSGTGRGLQTVEKMGQLLRRVVGGSLGEVLVPLVIPVSGDDKQGPFVVSREGPHLADHLQCQRIDPLRIIQEQHDRNRRGFGLFLIQEEFEGVEDLVDPLALDLFSCLRHRFGEPCFESNLLLL